MTGDHGCKACGRRIDVELADVVKQIDAIFADLDHIAEWQRPRPGVSIVIAAHGADGSDCAPPLEHFGRTDVAGVNDELGAYELREHLLTNEPMRIGNHANACDRMTFG